jgi:hypothetical protein
MTIIISIQDYTNLMHDVHADMDESDCVESHKRGEIQYLAIASNRFDKPVYIGRQICG